MTRSITESTDAAIVLSIILGKDPNDNNFTLSQPPIVPDFTRALNRHALEGKGTCVPRRVFFNESITKPICQLVVIKSLGAVVDPADLPSANEIVASNSENIVLETDFLKSSLSVLLSLYKSLNIFSHRFNLMKIAGESFRRS